MGYVSTKRVPRRARPAGAVAASIDAGLDELLAMSETQLRELDADDEAGAIARRVLGLGAAVRS